MIQLQAVKNELANSFLFGGGVFILVLVIFVVIILVSIRKNDKEKGLTPIYSERCGGQFGFVNATFPFVRLSLYSDFLVVSCYGKIIIEYARIRELRDIGFLGTGLEIVTTNQNKYGQTTIATFNRSIIKNIIKECIAENKLKSKQKNNSNL